MATTRKAPASTAANTTTTRTAAKPAARPAARTTATRTTAARATARPAATRVAAKAPVATKTKKAKPEPKKAYRLLTGIDDSAFCQKVSDALKDGYELYGSPSVTFNGKNVIAAQAVVLKKNAKKKKK
ncbi:MAG: DUF1737 domain-containing protein [Rhodoluna sp.]|nr:DUF1737 domain-containing protein [Rhodoluna sp.]